MFLIKNLLTFEPQSPKQRNWIFKSWNSFEFDLISSQSESYVINLLNVCISENRLDDWVLKNLEPLMMSILRQNWSKSELGTQNLQMLSILLCVKIWCFRMSHSTIILENVWVKWLQTFNTELCSSIACLWILPNQINKMIMKPSWLRVHTFSFNVWKRETKKVQILNRNFKFSQTFLMVPQRTR